MRRVEKAALIAVAAGGLAAVGMGRFVQAFVEGHLNEVDESLAQLVNIPAAIAANLIAGPVGPLNDVLFTTMSAVQWFALVGGAAYLSLRDWARQ